MIIKYANEKLKQQCTSVKAAVKLFGGDKNMAISLLSRINAIQDADVIKDIIATPQFRFHNLHGKLEGLSHVILMRLQELLKLLKLWR